MQAARGTPIGASGRVAGTHRYRWLFVAVAATGAVLDVLTKILAVASLTPAEPIRLLGGVLTLRLIRNPGAAFSLGEGVTPVFALLSASVLLFVVLRLVPRLGHPGWAVAMGLLCAGIAGNLTDRLLRQPGFMRGHVVDFLQLPHWPIFNVADMCITASATLIGVLSVVKNVGITGERYVSESKPNRSAAGAAPVDKPISGEGPST